MDRDRAPLDWSARAAAALDLHEEGEARTTERTKGRAGATTVRVVKCCDDAWLRCARGTMPARVRRTGVPGRALGGCWLAAAVGLVSLPRRRKMVA